MSTKKFAVGGRAFATGVQMQGRRVATANRRADGSIEITTRGMGNARFPKLKKIPVVRGMASVLRASAMGVADTVRQLRYKKADLGGENPLTQTLMYHGAEHMTVNCFESGSELTVAEVRNHSRIHPRCGTSVAVTAMLLQLLAELPLSRVKNDELRALLDNLTLLAAMGVSQELNKAAAEHPENDLLQLLTEPGRQAQRLTTAEPTDEMLECAIAALKAAVAEDPE